MSPVAELGLDLELVRQEYSHQLPHWDPRLWPATAEELQCARSRSSEQFRALGLSWAKHHLGRQRHTTTKELATTRPSHGRPEAAREKSPYVEAAEDGRKGGAGRAQAQRAEHGTGWASRTGKEEDVEVGLQYFGKRFLSPYLGRWVSADPLGVHSYDGDLNLYAYVRGMLLAAVDPLGLQETMRVNTIPKGMPDSMRQAAESGDATLRWTTLSAPGGSGGVRAVSEGELTDAARRGGGTIFEYDKNAGLSYSDALDFLKLQRDVARGEGQFEWMRPTIAPEHVWENDDSGLRELGAMAGTSAASAVPFVGEALDIAVLTHPDSTPGMKIAAAVSLAVNVLTAGFLPNAGGIIKSVPDDALRGATGASGVSSRAARREAMREAGIPTSQQPVSQQSTRVPGTNQPGGRQYTYEVPAAGGGKREMSVQHSLTDRVEGHGAHWEAGATKGAGRTDPLGRPRLGNDKVKVEEP